MIGSIMNNAADIKRGINLPLKDRATLVNDILP